MQKAYRLRHNASFSYIYKKGERLGGKYMLLYYVPARNTKVGVSISKKVGKAVFRNLSKRRIYESFAKLIPELNGKYNYVVVVSKSIQEATYQDIESDIKRMLIKLGHLTKDNDSTATDNSK